MNAAVNTFVSSMTFAVVFVVFGLARHGQVSWWLLGGIVVWGLALGWSGFNAGWDARGELRKRGRR